MVTVKTTTSTINVTNSLFLFSSYCLAVSLYYKCNLYFVPFFFLLICSVSVDAFMEGGGIFYDRYREPGKDYIKFFPKNKLILKNVTFEGNTAVEIGGALRVTDAFLHGTSVELDRDVKFVNNAAPEDKDGSFGVPYTFIDCQAGYYTLQDLNLLIESFDISIGCPKKCLPGSFGKGVARRIALESCEVCPLGSYCGNSGTIIPTICPKGYYCKPDDASDGEGIFYATPCPLGTYGNSTGLTSEECSGVCPIGHYW